MAIRTDELMALAFEPVTLRGSELARRVTFNGRTTNLTLGELLERYRLDMSYLSAFSSAFPEEEIRKAVTYSLEKARYGYSVHRGGWTYIVGNETSEERSERLQRLDGYVGAHGRRISRVLADGLYPLIDKGVVVVEGSELPFWKALEYWSFRVVNGVSVPVDSPQGKKLLLGKEYRVLHQYLMHTRRWEDAVVVVVQRTLRQWLRLGLRKVLIEKSHPLEVATVTSTGIDEGVYEGLTLEMWLYGDMFVLNDHGNWSGPYHPNEVEEVMEERWPHHRRITKGRVTRLSTAQRKMRGFNPDSLTR